MPIRQLGEALLERVLAHLSAATLNPLPRRVFRLARPQHAFRYMAQARHIGKVVLRAARSGAASQESALRPDATYLITGGLGALGLAVARWLVSGARAIGAGRPARTVIRAADRASTRCEPDGARVSRSCAADVCRSRDVDRLVARRSATSVPPLRASSTPPASLDDGSLAQQTWATIREGAGGPRSPAPGTCTG